MSFARKVTAIVEEGNPATFAAVMATGIVSLAASSQGYGLVAEGLLVANALAGGLLALRQAAQLALFPGGVRARFGDPLDAAGFFTIPAGICVLGSQLLALTGARALALALWWLAALIWLATTYGFFAVLALRPAKGNLARQVDGGTCVSVVATEAVAILAMEFGTPTLLTVGFALTLVGAVLYLLILGAVFHRLFFLNLAAADLKPSYWIVMGVEAVAALAATTAIEHAPQSTLLRQSLPFLLPFALAFWSMAGWWMPLLLVLGLWRYRRHWADLTFDAPFWGMVFPLGMYSMASHGLGVALHASWAEAVAEVAFWVALAAWAATAAGTAIAFARRR